MRVSLSAIAGLSLLLSSPVSAQVADFHGVSAGETRSPYISGNACIFKGLATHQPVLARRRATAARRCVAWRRRETSAEGQSI